MFLVQVALGKSFMPANPMPNLAEAPDGYHSVFAKANKSSVRNNEMIVYDTRQANPRYLVEFGPAM